MDDASTIRLVAPAADFIRQSLNRLPLGETVLHLLRYVLHKDFLDNLYEQHRGQGYEDILSFARLVELVADALLVHGGSARKSLIHAQKHDALPTCKEAFYGKLRRLPLPLSIPFLTEASSLLHALLPASDNPLPASVQRFDVLIVDGKKTKHVAKRLKLTRQCAGQLFGSKLLVGFNPVTRLIQNAAAHIDGEKNDNPLVPELLASLEPAGPRARIIVCDAQFCDLVQISLYQQQGDHFLVRYHPKLHFHADPARPATEFTDRKGRRLIEEHGWLGGPQDKRRCYVRRITWKRTDHKDLIVVTDLHNERAGSVPIPAADLIDLYLIRWRIETVFQEVTTVFGLKKLIGSTAEATAFQAVFCMVVYNIIQVVRAYIATTQTKPLPVDDVSSTMLFDSIRKELSALTVLVPPLALAEAIKPLRTVEHMRAYLQSRLGGLWEQGWRKARNRQPRCYGPKKKGSGAHTSVYRVLQDHKMNPKAAPKGG